MRTRALLGWLWRSRRGRPQPERSDPVASVEAVGNLAAPKAGEPAGGTGAAPAFANPPIERLVVGTPTIAFAARPISLARFATTTTIPDTALDGWTAGGLTVRAASCRGDEHRWRGTPRQDEFALASHPSGRLIIAVCDGVSNSPHSHLGAAAAARATVATLVAQLDAAAPIDWTPVAHAARAALLDLAMARDGTCETARDYSTTLCAAVVEREDDAFRARVLPLGDSGALVMTADAFVTLGGGKTENEGGLTSSAVVALPRLPTGFVERTVRFGASSVLLLASDGVLDPLGPGTGSVGRMLREALAVPPDLLAFARVADFSRETFDDDRTLVAVWPAAPAGG